jgi:RNA polymerase sigma factor (sigma-70 family)
MTAQPLRQVVRQLRQAVHAPTQTAAADCELLRRFAIGREEAAFEALLRRHGSMVLRVAQRLLHHRQDAEDVFQATFLTLAGKAASIRQGASVGCWLHGVARHLALQTKSAAVRRATHETHAEQRTVADPLAVITVREAQATLDEELARLPERPRAALVLCYLEGATQDEAARQLGWSSATLRRRLEQGRHLLRVRLARRGLTLSAALLGALLGAEGRAAQTWALTSRVFSGCDMTGNGSFRFTAR